MQLTVRPSGAKRNFAAANAGKVAKLASNVNTGWYRLVPVSIDLKKEIFCSCHPLAALGTKWHSLAQLGRTFPQKYFSQLSPPDICKEPRCQTSFKCLTPVAASASLASAVRPVPIDQEDLRPKRGNQFRHSCIPIATGSPLFAYFSPLRVLCRFTAKYGRFRPLLVDSNFQTTRCGVFVFTHSHQTL